MANPKPKTAVKSEKAKDSVKAEVKPESVDADHGSAKTGHHGGQPFHIPTDKIRQRVLDLASIGKSHKRICLTITAEGVKYCASSAALRKYYAKELAEGAELCAGDLRSIPIEMAFDLDADPEQRLRAVEVHARTEHSHAQISQKKSRQSQLTPILN